MFDRRLPQFSLKTLLATVTGLCVLAAFVAGCPEIASPLFLIFCIATAPGYCFGVAINALVRSRTSPTPARSHIGQFRARIAALIPRRLPIVPVSAGSACTLLCVAMPSSRIGAAWVGITIILAGASIFGAMFPCRLQTIPTLVATICTLLFVRPESPFTGAGIVGLSLTFAAASILGIAFGKGDCRAFFVGSVLPTLWCVVVLAFLMTWTYSSIRSPAPVFETVSWLLEEFSYPPLISLVLWVSIALGGACIAARRAIGRFRAERLKTPDRA